MRKLVLVALAALPLVGACAADVYYPAPRYSHYRPYRPYYYRPAPPAVYVAPPAVYVAPPRVHIW